MNACRYEFEISEVDIWLKNMYTNLIAVEYLNLIRWFQSEKTISIIFQITHKLVKLSGNIIIPNTSGQFC
jgi:hypothetical protein